MQALARVDRNSCRRGMSRGKLLVGAGAGTKVVGVCASICSSTSSSSSPSTITGPPGRHHIHRTLHGESIKSDCCREVAGFTDFVTAVAGGGGAADDRTHDIAHPYASSPPARRMAPGARSLCVAGERVRYLLRLVGSRQRLVWCVSGGARVVVCSPSMPHTRPFVGHST